MKKILLVLAAFCTLSFHASAQETEYQGEVYLGYAGGVGEWNVDRVNIETVHGVRVGSHFSAGLGLGWHHYTQDGESATVIPVFLNLKGYLLDNDITPYFSLDLGYGIGAGDWGGLGGLYISPGVGASFKVGTNKNSAVNVGVAFQSQSISESGVSVSLNAIALRVGFRF